MSFLFNLAGIVLVLFRGKMFSPFFIASDSEALKQIRGTTQVLDFLQHFIVDASDDGSYEVQRINNCLLVIRSGEHNYRIECTPICIIVSDNAGEEVEI